MAIYIVTSRRRRTELSELRHALMGITNPYWRDSFEHEGIPEWYKKAELLRDRLIKIIEMHLMCLENIPEFQEKGWGGYFRGNVPDYLKEWDDAWETTILETIKELQLNLAI